MILPAEGRTGDAPDWPLEPEASKREAAVWRELWKRPQAVAWEHNRLDLEVGLYVRRFCEAEEPGAKVTLSTVVRQMADSLGLSPVGLRSNRWTIGPPPDSKRTPSTAGTSRARLKVVSNDDDGQAPEVET